MEFFGHRIGRNGLSVMQDKIEAIKAWPPLTDATDVRSFLGLTGFYRKFVKDYGRIALPLTELTKDDVSWEWGTSQEAAFRELQEALCAAPVLAIPDPKLPYTLHIDASGYALGGVLQQDAGEGLRPVAFMSVKMKGAQLRYAVHEQELLALVTACKHWRHYLHSELPFTILSDHNSLRFFSSQPLLSNRQARWKDQLAEFDFTIQYIEGPKNLVADALSRRADHRPPPSEECKYPVPPPRAEMEVRPGDSVSKEAFLAALTFNRQLTVSVSAHTQAGRSTHCAVCERLELAAARARRPQRSPVPDTALEIEQRLDFRAAARQNVDGDAYENADGLPAPNRQGTINTPSQRCTASTKAGAHDIAGIRKCANSATPQVVNPTRPMESMPIGRRLRRKSCQGTTTAPV